MLNINVKDNLSLFSPFCSRLFSFVLAIFLYIIVLLYFILEKCLLKFISDTTSQHRARLERETCNIDIVGSIPSLTN
jgi:hypothetical protein